MVHQLLLADHQLNSQKYVKLCTLKTAVVSGQFAELKKTRLSSKTFGWLVPRYSMSHLTLKLLKVGSLIQPEHS